MTRRSGEVVAEYQWAWQIPMLERLETLVPESVLRAWRDADPFCREYSWQNVLLAFAWGRAVQLGICSRPAVRKTVLLLFAGVRRVRSVASRYLPAGS